MRFQLIPQVHPMEHLSIGSAPLRRGMGQEGIYN